MTAVFSVSVGAPTTRKWTLSRVFGISVYVGFTAVALLSVPNMIWDDVNHHVVVVVGALGLWRFGWWGTHVVRAWIFYQFVYPMMRTAADRVWNTARWFTTRSACSPSACRSSRAKACSRSTST